MMPWDELLNIALRLYDMAYQASIAGGLSKEAFEGKVKKMTTEHDALIARQRAREFKSMGGGG